jgi:hypothetical protein
MSYDMVHRYVRDNGHGLTIHVNFMVKCVCYFMVKCEYCGSNGYFVTGAALMGGHYRIYIISGVGHPMSDSVMPLVLWTIEFNIRGTSFVLQFPRDTTNPTKKV